MVIVVTTTTVNRRVVMAVTNGFIHITKPTPLPVTPVIFRATTQTVLSKTIKGTTNPVTRIINEVGSKVSIVFLLLM